MEASEFIRSFNIRDGGEFYNPVELKDVKMGFSVMRKVGPEGWVSLFYIYIRNVDIERESEIKPLVIRVNNGRLREDKEIPYISLGDGAKKIMGPLELTSKGDYFYNTKLKKFYKNDKEISGQDILDEVYLLHIKPTRVFRGLWLRIKLLFWRVFLTFIIKLISDFFQVLLYIVSGSEFIPIFSRNMKVNEARVHEPESNSKYKDSEKWDFFGIKAPIWPISFFCVFHIIGYAVFW